MIDIIKPNLFTCIIGVGIALLGILIQRTRLYSLIAGYNTMPAYKQKKVNIELVTIALRNAFLLIGTVWIIIPIVTDLVRISVKLKYGLLAGLHILICALLIIIVNTQKKT
jgi:hypothetical protein